MIELIQFPWSPFCIVQRRILEFSGHPFQITDIPCADRALVWKLTRQRYYGVPVIRDGRQVVFELNDHTQVIAKYLDAKFQLGLFPADLEGIQSILWRYLEGEVEGTGFRLNDIYWKEIVPPADQLLFLRHKERKFGRGCLAQWCDQRKELLKQLAARLLPLEQMLARQPFLLGQRPRFVDFDLYGMLGNFLYSGHYRLPARQPSIQRWYRRMATLKFETLRK
jgi:glutathione S-transferase